jgi:hypothetical protein
MPLPSPRPKEGRKRFIERCMEDLTAESEFSDNDQRYAVCLGQWRGEHKDADFDAQQALMDAAEASYARDVQREKDRFTRLAAKEYQQTGGQSALLFIDHVMNMQSITKFHTDKTIRAFVGHVTREVKDDFNNLEHKDAFEDTLFGRLSNTWMVLFGAQQIRDAARTTQRDINTAINAGTQAGEASSQIVKRILNVFKVNRQRAKVIARTETHNAAMYASEGTAKAVEADLDVQLTKQWRPSLDERTRVNHAIMADADPVDMDANFIVGGRAMSRPGDPKGGASNVINCRCVLRYKRK